MSKARTLAGTVSDGAVLADGTVDASEIGSLTLPSGGDIVGTTAVQTLTNKTIDIASNTLTGVQATLLSGTNIKTINGGSVLGSGDLVVGGGSLIFLSSVTASAASTVSFISGINSTYDDYIIEVSNLGVSVGSSRLLYEISENNGSSYLSGTYFSNEVYLYAGTIGGQQRSAATGSVTNDVYTINTTTSSHISFRLCNVNATSARKQFLTSASLSSIGAAVRDLTNSAYTVSTGPINAIKFSTASGATINGTFRLYGIKKN